MKSYKHWELHECLPDGYKRDKSTGSPLQGYDFAINGSPLKGGKRILVRATSQQNPNAIKREAVATAIRVALRNLGNADLNESEINHFADDYINQRYPSDKDGE